MESLQSHSIPTMSHWSSGLTLCFPSQGTWVSKPLGGLMWNRDSPVSVVSLHWWPRRDWSSWPRLRRASSRTITRPSCRQCDNPTWSHTAFPRFHTRCRSPFRLHNRRSRLLGGSPMQILQSLSILTMSQWSSGLPVCFPPQGTQVQIPWGVPMWNQDSPVSVVSLHWWPRCDLSSWPRLRRASSRTITRPLCRQCDNPTWSHIAFLSRFHACRRSSFQLHNRRSRLLGGSPVESLQSHSILTMSHWSSGLTLCFLSQGTWVQNPWGDLCETGILLLAMSRYMPWVSSFLPRPVQL